MNQENKNTPPNSRAFFREWLEKLQQESWQLELIISGFALYGIWSSKGALVDLKYFSSQHDGMLIGPTTILFEVGWKIFFINLLIHVILRSLWIGAIGLRYVSDEIDYDELKYSERFTSYLRRKVGDYDDFIEKLEKICSVLFSYTFLLFLLFMSMLIYIMGFVIPFQIQDWLGYNDVGQKHMTIPLIWIFTYLFFGIVVFIDFITLGGLKRIQDKTFSKIYMPIYRFYSTITLSFLYRPLLYNFIDNKYTKRLFYLSLPYMFLIASGHRMFNENRYPHIPLESVKNGIRIDESFYDDLYEQKLIYLNEEEQKEYKHFGGLRLSAFNMKQSYNSVFIKHSNSYKRLLEKRHGITPIYKDGWQFTLFSSADNKVAKDSMKMEIEADYKIKYDQVSDQYKAIRDSIRKKKIETSDLELAKAKQDSLRKLRSRIGKDKAAAIHQYKVDKEKLILKTLQSFLNVSIDGEDYNDRIECYFANHPNRAEQGIRCYFDIEDLTKGMHQMEVEKVRRYDSDKDSVSMTLYILPFVKQF